MIKFSDNFISPTWYQLQQINIHRCRYNIQNSMLSHPDLNIIAIDNYKQEIFITFMLADVAYVTCLFN